MQFWGRTNNESLHRETVVQRLTPHCQHEAHNLVNERLLRVWVAFLEIKNENLGELVEGSKLAVHTDQPDGQQEQRGQSVQSSSALSCVLEEWLWRQSRREGVGFFFGWILSKSSLLLLVSPVLQTPSFNANRTETTVAQQGWDIGSIYTTT